MNENSPFFIEPRSGFRRSYSRLALDVGIPTASAWFDALDGNSNAAEELARRDVACVDAADSDDSDTGLLDAPGCYRVFVGVVNALVSGREWELSAEAGGRSIGADELLVNRPSPVVPRDPPGGRVRDSGGVLPEERVSGGDDLGSLILRSPAKLGIRTSGTTGRPKLVWHSMQSLARAVKTGERHSTDVWGFAYEPTHFAGLQVFLQALANQNPIIWLFDLAPEEARVAIKEYGVTHLSATPTFLKMLCGGVRPMVGVRSVTLGGEAFDPAAFAEVSRAFPKARVRNIYASTELGSLLQADGDVFSVPTRLRRKLKVEEGELHVAGEMLAQSLLCDEGAFFPTGDRVEVVTEEPLSFRFIGRRGDWINVGGTKVNPHKIEAAISELAGVSAVRAFGQPNSVIGNIVACEIVLADEAALTENDLKQQLSDKLSRYEMPQIWKYVGELSVTRTGKKQR
ncbi:MAG: hypothetical protein Aurels2KO_27070 [Aureliella sp.]